VVLGLEGEARRAAHAAHLERELFGVAVGREVEWQVWDAEQEVSQLGLDLLLLGFDLAELLLELASGVLQRGDVPTGLGVLLHLPGDVLGFGA